MSVDRIIALGRSRRQVLSAAPVIIGAIVLYNWTISPQLSYLRAVQRLEPVVDGMAEQNDRICGGLADKRQRLQMMQQQLHDLGDQLFTYDESRTLVRDLQSLIEQTGCTVILAELTRGNDRQAEDPSGPGGVEALRVRLTLRGQYDEITAVLGQIGAHNPRMWVKTCQIDLLDRRGGQLECRLALTVYARRNEGGAGNE